jgi:hypothetical protein
MGERFQREHSHFGPSILFPKISKKVLERNALAARFLRSPRPRLARGVDRREREHVNRDFLIKPILEGKTNAFVMYCSGNI